MIFMTRDGRTLRQRVLSWVEEKADRLQRELHHERKEREQRYELRHHPYYDTFESWSDGLTAPYASDSFRLFTDAARSVRRNVANYDGQGCFGSGTKFVVARMYAVVTASEEKLAERVRLGTNVELAIGNMEYLNFALDDAEHAPTLEKTIVITPFQNYHVALRFSPEIAALLRELKTKVGPGAGWVSIRVVLDGLLKREVL